MPTSHLHPDSKLRLDFSQHHLRYDGAREVHVNCTVLSPDGRDTGLKEAYCHRVAPNQSRGVSVDDLETAAYLAHHAHLGLNDPPVLPLHLHPQGYPGTEEQHPTPPSPTPVTPTSEDHRTLRDYIVAAKSREIGRALDPATHPLSTLIPPTDHTKG